MDHSIKLSKLSIIFEFCLWEIVIFTGGIPVRFLADFRNNGDDNDEWCPQWWAGQCAYWA